MKTKTIYFLRTAPYEYLIKGKSLYESFNIVARNDVGILLNSDAELIFRNSVPKGVLESNSVYTSPRNGLPQTANFINNNIIKLNILKEIGYRMENFIAEKDFYDKEGNPNINLARERFVNAFIENKLSEKNSEVFKRIEYLLKILSEDDSASITVISHGFILKIIESYIRSDNLNDNMLLIKKYFNGKVEGFKFCEGFQVDLKFNKFKFIKYIKNT